MTFLTILPMAFVMIAGPQILTAIFLATSEHWQRNTAAYLTGAALSITLVVSLAYLLSSGATRQGPSDTVYVIVLVLLVAAGVHVFLARKTAEPPKWMGKLQTANPRFSLQLGFLLLGVFPTDILTSVAVGSYLAGHGDPSADRSATHDRTSGWPIAARGAGRTEAAHGGAGGSRRGLAW